MKRSKKNKLSEVADIISPKPPLRPLRGLRAKVPYIPSLDDPRAELKRLVKQHKAWTRKAVALEAMASDRKNHKTGERIPCDLPEDIRVGMHAQKDALKRVADDIKSSMEKELRRIPIYTSFLEGVYGCGEVVSAYLVSEVDIAKAVKISNLRRYCGLAVINGHLERRSGAAKAIGGTGTFNSELRTRLYQMFLSMKRNSAKRLKAAPFGVTSKYLDVWHNVFERELHSEANAEREALWSHAIAKGWHKAADLFIEDLYVVWRALEGLPVWPSYYSAKLGYAHASDKIVVNQPKSLTLDEALELVGYVGSTPRTEPVSWRDDDGEGDVELEAAE